MSLFFRSMMISFCLKASSLSIFFADLVLKVKYCFPCVVVGGLLTLKMMSDWKSLIQEESDSDFEKIMNIWKPLREDTSADWDIKTAVSSQDSGYQQSSHSSSSLRLQKTVNSSSSLGLESLRTGEFLATNTNQDGQSESSLKVLHSLMSSVERPVGRPISGSSRVNPLDLSYTSQISNLTKFVDRDIPLTFPGQIVKHSSKPPAVPNFSSLESKSNSSSASPACDTTPQSQFKPQSVKNKSAGRRKKRPRLVSSGDLEEEMAAVSRQMVVLTMERAGYEDILGFKERKVRTNFAEDRETPLERLLRKTSYEQERIICLLERVEKISGTSDALYTSLGRMEAVTRDIYVARNNTDGQDNLAQLFLNLVTIIRRIRTNLWTIVNFSI